MPQTHHRSSSGDISTHSRAPTTSTKSSVPAFINIDDCKPILATTTTNTSSNSSQSGSAFVFTSSRTLRALQDQDVSAHRSPPSSDPSTPSTPSSIAAQDHVQQSRASLTLSQLVKHSEGALDARSLLGPKMKAAGFVNLPHTIGSRSGLNSPSTPSSPSLFTTSRDPEWSLCSADHGRQSSSKSRAATGNPVHHPSPQSSPSRRILYAPPKPPSHGSSSSSGSESSGLFSLSPSSTNASGSSSTSLTSVEEIDEDRLRRSSSRGKGKARANEGEPTEYPFPTSCDSPRSQGSRGSRGSRASSATASPTVMGVIPPARPGTALALTLVPPMAGTTQRNPQVRATPRLQHHPPHHPPVEVPESGKGKAVDKPAIQPTPTFATAKRPGYQRQYSLTELTCDSSPFVWLTKSDMFAPPAPIARSPLRTPASSGLIYPPMSRPPPPVDDSPFGSQSLTRHRRRHTTFDGRSSNPDPSTRVHLIASAPIRMPTIPSDPGTPCDQRSEKHVYSNRSGRHRDHGQYDGVEQEPSQTLLPSANNHDQLSKLDGSGGVRLESGGRRERGRDTRGKVLAASKRFQERVAAATEEGDIEKEKEHALEGLAALALAHKERADEFARHIATDRQRTKVLQQKQRAYHKLGGKTLKDEDASESEVTMVDHHAPAVKIVP